MKKTKENAEVTAKETTKKPSGKAKKANKSKSEDKRIEPRPKYNEVEIKEYKDTVSDSIDKVKKDNKAKLEFQFLRLLNELRGDIVKVKDIKSDFIVRKSKVRNLEVSLNEKINLINEMRKTFKTLNL